MLDFCDFVVELESGLPTGYGDEGFSLGVTGIELSLPVEARIVGRGGIELSTPRGRLETGFAIEHGRLRLNFVRSGLTPAQEEALGAEPLDADSDADSDQEEAQ